MRAQVNLVAAQKEPSRSEDRDGVFSEALGVMSLSAPGADLFSHDPHVYG